MKYQKADKILHNPNRLKPPSTAASTALFHNILLYSLIASLYFIQPSNVYYAARATPDTIAIRAVLPPPNCTAPVNAQWMIKVNHLKWVDYSSPNLNPEQGYFQPSADAIYQDLSALRKAKFTGLVTYGSAGVMGNQFLTIAESLGFKGVIMGIWDPNNQTELNNAIEASPLPIVLGFSIGNEGLYGSHDRYTLSSLCSSISTLRASANKPVTTSEEIDDYTAHDELLSVGDWVFPNAHPYWHSTIYADAAVQWEQDQYKALTKKTDHFVLFKEVGLPTAGAYGLSETNNDSYYRALAQTDVRFVYFEGFDQPSKTNSSVEPSWGLFGSDRRPKLLGWNLIGSRPFTSSAVYDGWVLGCATSESGCSINSNDIHLRVGQDAQGREYRSFLSFNTSALPDDAIISSVTLRVKLAGLAGVNPFSKGQNLIAESCSPFFGQTAYLNIADYDFNAHCKIIGTFDKMPANGWLTLRFNSDNFTSIDLTGITQFRLRFIDNGYAKESYILLYGGDADTSNQPILVVKYSAP